MPRKGYAGWVMERLRTARPEDQAAVTALLGLSYGALLADAYPADLLSRALPFITRANPVLLASGRYALIEDDTGQPVACGGWSLERPGSAVVIQGLAHIRHFAVHPGAIRRGLGRQLYQWCEDAARAARATEFECHASLNAEAFYRRLGFRRAGEMHLRLVTGVAFPALVMVKGIAP